MNWIMTDDALPQDGQKVIYYFKHVGIHMGKYDAKSNTFYSSAGFLQDDVTHWMPALL
jgi:hypothetical protein